MGILFGLDLFPIKISIHSLYYDTLFRRPRLSPFL